MNISPKELNLGINVEKEHTGDLALAQKSAMDHLKGDAIYYSRLVSAGLVDEPEVTQMAAMDRAESGQKGSVSLPKPVTPTQMAGKQATALRTSNLGKNTAPLKSSGLDSIEQSNTIADKTTKPLEPAPEHGGLPHGVTIGNTPEIGGSSKSPKQADHLSHYCAKIDAVLDIGIDENSWPYDDKGKLLPMPPARGDAKPSTSIGVDNPGGEHDEFDAPPRTSLPKNRNKHDDNPDMDRPDAKYR
jgi:hypothetical protein